MWLENVGERRRAGRRGNEPGWQGFNTVKNLDLKKDGQLERARSNKGPAEPRSYFPAPLSNKRGHFSCRNG